ncbi:MAG: glycosyltransferase [Acidimicrobiales bacterium]
MTPTDAPPGRRRVLWLIKGLGPGGAERLLVTAAAVHDRDAFDLHVAYLLPWKDHLVGELQALGVRCTCLEVRDERDLRWALRLRRLLRQGRFDVLHMHSPYAAGAARLVVRSLPRAERPRLVTTEHNPWSTYRRPTWVANALTAPLDDAVLAVSAEARASLPERRRHRAEALAHGVPVQDIRALLSQRDAVRRELGVTPGTFLMGTIANYHRKKDWPTLLSAARIVSDSGAGVRFCAVGQGPLEEPVKELHRELSLEHVVR